MAAAELPVKFKPTVGEIRQNVFKLLEMKSNKVVLTSNPLPNQVLSLQGFKTNSRGRVYSTFFKINFLPPTSSASPFLVTRSHPLCS